MKVCLISRNGTVTARRIKADDCYLEAKGVEILSSLEAADLAVVAGDLGLIVKKRMGVNNFASVKSRGPVKIGSLFSNMANLPTVTGSSDTSSEAFEAAIKSAVDSKQAQTLIISDDGMTIDNLQGVVTLKSSQFCIVALHTVESAKLIIDAPLAHVKMNLRSIHDISHVRCAKAEIIVHEGFDKCRVFDQLSKSFVEIGDARPENVPILNVHAKDGLKVTVMSEFEMLRRRIMEGMAARKKQ